MTGQCPRLDQPCPVNPCPGTGDAGACDHWRRLNAWRRVTPAEQEIQVSAEGRARLDPRVRDAVLACPDRGGVLPLALQDDCGCLGVERTECRAGLGRAPGRVTLRECLTCRAGVLGIGASA